jgi:UDP-3-O-[3-hydroxymyristoyl] glucosamine N-acyltransferase
MKINKPLTLKEAAIFLGIKYIGAPEMLILGINEIHKVEPGDLTFVDIEKYYHKALNSNATFILINKDIECPLGKALLISDNPFKDYCKLVLKYWVEEKVPNTGYYIAPDAIVGEGTKIYPGACINNGVVIGKNCIIHANVVLHTGTILNDRVEIKANTVIGGDAFYFKGYGTHFDKWPSCGRIIIHDDVHIGSCCTIDKGVSGDTIIGKHTKIDNHIHIAHGVEIGERCLFAAQTGIAGKTIIEDDVTVWGQCGIIKSIRVGKGAVILSKSLVTKPLEGNKVYTGNPAREKNVSYRELAALRMLPKFLEEINSEKN